MLILLFMFFQGMFLVSVSNFKNSCRREICSISIKFDDISPTDLSSTYIWFNVAFYPSTRKLEELGFSQLFFTNQTIKFINPKKDEIVRTLNPPDVFLNFLINGKSNVTFQSKNEKEGTKEFWNIQSKLDCSPIVFFGGLIFPIDSKTKIEIEGGLIQWCGILSTPSPSSSINNIESHGTWSFGAKPYNIPSSSSIIFDHNNINPLVSSCDNQNYILPQLVGQPRNEIIQLHLQNNKFDILGGTYKGDKSPIGGQHNTTETISFNCNDQFSSLFSSKTKRFLESDNSILEITQTDAPTHQPTDLPTEAPTEEPTEPFAPCSIYCEQNAVEMTCVEMDHFKNYVIGNPYVYFSAILSNPEEFSPGQTLFFSKQIVSLLNGTTPIVSAKGQMLVFDLPDAYVTFKNDSSRSSATYIDPGNDAYWDIKVNQNCGNIFFGGNFASMPADGIGLTECKMKWCGVVSTTNNGVIATPVWSVAARMYGQNSQNGGITPLATDINSPTCDSGDPNFSYSANARLAGQINNYFFPNFAYPGGTSTETVFDPNTIDPVGNRTSVVANGVCRCFPTPAPTLPTNQPTLSPTNFPTNAPTENPTIEPTIEPTVEPTVEPTIEPTDEPSFIFVTIPPSPGNTFSPTQVPPPYYPDKGDHIVMLAGQRKNKIDNFITKDQFNDMFNSGGKIFRLDIGGSIKPHSFYRRITDDYFDAYENIIGMFASSNNNINENFKIYSTYYDLINDQNAWSNCVYNKGGYPSGCRPTSKKREEEQNMPIYWQNLTDASIYVYTGEPNCQGSDERDLVLYNLDTSPYKSVLESMLAQDPNLQINKIDFMTCNKCFDGQKFTLNDKVNYNARYWTSPCFLITTPCDYTCPVSAPTINNPNGPNPPTSNPNSTNAPTQPIISSPGIVKQIQQVFGNKTVVSFVPVYDNSGHFQGISLNISNCTILTEVVIFVNNFFAELIPGGGYKIIQSNCEVFFVYYNRSLGAISAISVLLFPLLIFLFFIIRHYLQRKWITTLPPEISWSFLQYKDSLGIGWKKYWGGSSNIVYYYKDYHEGNYEWDRVMEIFEDSMQGQDFKVTQVRAIYNPTLLRNFINLWHLFTARYYSSHQTFFSIPVPYNEQQNWIIHNLKELCNYYSWNKKLSVPIIPTAHGTDFAIAEKISQTGFANLSFLDDGFYGKGIYFSSSAEYIYPYFGNKKTPGVIISYVNLGNIYPTYEHHQADDTLMGKKMKSGYNSHYVLVERLGLVIEGTQHPPSNVFDEIVIEQEAQIVPAFILKISKQRWSQDPNNVRRERKRRKDDTSLPIVLNSSTSENTISPELKSGFYLVKITPYRREMSQGLIPKNCSKKIFGDTKRTIETSYSIALKQASTKSENPIESENYSAKLFAVKNRNSKRNSEYIDPNSTISLGVNISPMSESQTVKTEILQIENQELTVEIIHFSTQKEALSYMNSHTNVVVENPELFITLM